MKIQGISIQQIEHVAEVKSILLLMNDVISRLPSQDLFAMDDEEYFHSHIQDMGAIFGAYLEKKLVAYSVLSFPGFSEYNLGREFGIVESNFPYVAALDSTVVHESVRGLGLQIRFHEIREKRAREKGCKYMYSTVHPQNITI